MGTWKVIFSEGIEIGLDEVLKVVWLLEQFDFLPETGSTRFLALYGFCRDFLDLDIVNNLNHVEIIRDYVSSRI